MCVCVCVCVYMWKKITDSNPTIYEEQLTNNPNRKGGFIEKPSRHSRVSVLLSHYQNYESFY